MREAILEAWRTNNRINLLLIDKISEEGMACTLSRRGGRDVCRQFAHMHNVRASRLEHWARELARGLVTFETKERPDKVLLRDALTASGKAVESFLAVLADGGNGQKGFRKGLPTTLAYFVAHESHHRGSILLTLKECGHKLDQDTSYAIWDWDRM